VRAEGEGRGEMIKRKTGSVRPSEEGRDKEKGPRLSHIQRKNRTVQCGNSSLIKKGKGEFKKKIQREGKKDRVLSGSFTVRNARDSAELFLVEGWKHKKFDDKNHKWRNQ